MHLAQCRAQHHLIRSQAIQRIDVEREEFSGQLLAVATEGISELTSAVQRASEPVLNMLKSSCATGTKSEHEVDRIGRIGEALKEEVADILRYKTQVAWTRLQERAKQGPTNYMRVLLPSKLYLMPFFEAYSSIWVGLSLRCTNWSLKRSLPLNS